MWTRILSWMYGRLVCTKLAVKKTEKLIAEVYIDSFIKTGLTGFVLGSFMCEQASWYYTKTNFDILEILWLLWQNLVGKKLD